MCVDSSHLRAAVFDLDGVVTDTARVHARAWKQLFDEFLCDRAQPGGVFEPFDLDHDYRRYVDGKRRFDGVASFLASRGIALPWASGTGEEENESIVALGNRKDGYFRERLQHDGVEVFDDSIRLIADLHSLGWRVAVASSSRNCRPVLERAAIAGLFEARVDGVVSDELALPGKPDPAIFVEAARRIGVAPVEAMVVEDAVAGVEAARRGGFGLVVGLAREGGTEGLRRAGADVVVQCLDDVLCERRGTP